jgi:hypothetical protein
MRFQPSVQSNPGKDDFTLKPYRRGALGLPELSTPALVAGIVGLGVASFLVVALVRRASTE